LESLESEIHIAVDKNGKVTKEEITPAVHAEGK